MRTFFKLTAGFLLTVSAAVMISGDRAEGFSYYAYGGTRVVWAGKQSLRYLSPNSFPDGSDEQLLMLAGMGLWTMVPACDFVYYYDPNGVDYLDHYDGYNDTIAAELDPGVLAATWMVNNGAYWYDMDQAYSPLPGGVGWTFDPNPTCAMISNPATEGYSLLLVATHELGHALGLGHDPFGTEPPGSPWFIGTMNPRYPAGGPVGDRRIFVNMQHERARVKAIGPGKKLLVLSGGE